MRSIHKVSFLIHFEFHITVCLLSVRTLGNPNDGSLGLRDYVIDIAILINNGVSVNLQKLDGDSLAFLLRVGEVEVLRLWHFRDPRRIGLFLRSWR